MVTQRHDFGRVRETVSIPELLEFHRSSFRGALERGIQEVLNSAPPTTEATRHYEMRVTGFRLSDPIRSIGEALAQDLTYAARMYLSATLTDLKTGEVTTDENIYICELPLMTDAGTFVVNGSERTVVSQLRLAPGAYFSTVRAEGSGALLAQCRVRPPLQQGKWLEIQTKVNGAVKVRADKKTPLPVTTFFAALDLSIERLKAVFDEIDPSGRSWDATVGKAGVPTPAAARVELSRKVRPSDAVSAESATKLVHDMYRDPTKYSLGRVGRFMINRRLGLDVPADETLLTETDFLALVRRVLEINAGITPPDDTDHLANKRIVGVGERLCEHIRIGLDRCNKITRQKIASLQDIAATGAVARPVDIFHIRPLQASIRELFLSSALAPHVDQTNILDELTHKRRVTALGPGGLDRQRAGMEARDVHTSHYGRLCPIETPEGPNIGLINALALFARISPLGFVETPYRRVVRAKGGMRVTNDLVFLTADAEEPVTIAQANTPLDSSGRFAVAEVEARRRGVPVYVAPSEVDLMDVSPKQLLSAAAALIPFLEHDDGSRAMMGANMQRQAVPLITPEIPIVGTGLERTIARDSGHLITATGAGTVTRADHESIAVAYDDGTAAEFPLIRTKRTNAKTIMTHTTRVRAGDRVAAGGVLADASATKDGELALGRNIVAAFMPFDGGNFEDAMVVSERLVRDGLFNSVRLEKAECKAVTTKLGPEHITRDLPNVDQDDLCDLDERGIIRVGAKVRPGTILVGKIAPKPETEPTPVDKLMHALFGDKSANVKDASKRADPGEYGEVVKVEVFTKKDRLLQQPEFAGVQQFVRVTIATERQLQVGDKMAGRHGNKGIVARILPVADMPYLADGTPIDVVLNPLGVPSRMNVGQILEAHLGWAAAKLGRTVATPVFDGATESDIREWLREAGLPENGKATLYDGRSGEAFASPVTVGVMYLMKLHHQVDDKLHARSIGPYALITQQPLGGKAQLGGQRLGEMEVWALEAHGAAHNLRELTTSKSDDHAGRVHAYSAAIHGGDAPPPEIPAAFRVLVKELQALGLTIELLDQEGAPVAIRDRATLDLTAIQDFRDAGSGRRFD